jgi:hypothetical protein
MGRAPFLTAQVEERIMSLILCRCSPTEDVAITLVRANEALADLRSGRLQGAGVLVP